MQTCSPQYSRTSAHISYKVSELGSCLVTPMQRAAGMPEGLHHSASGVGVINYINLTTDKLLVRYLLEAPEDMHLLF